MELMEILTYGDNGDIDIGRLMEIFDIWRLMEILTCGD